MVSSSVIGHLSVWDPGLGMGTLWIVFDRLAIMRWMREYMMMFSDPSSHCGDSLSRMLSVKSSSLSL